LETDGMVRRSWGVWGRRGLVLGLVILSSRLRDEGNGRYDFPQYSPPRGTRPPSGKVGHHQSNAVCRCRIVLETDRMGKVCVWGGGDC
jgi:hypothetical protein